MWTFLLFLTPPLDSAASSLFSALFSLLFANVRFFGLDFSSSLLSLPSCRIRSWFSFPCRHRDPSLLVKSFSPSAALPWPESIPFFFFKTEIPFLSTLFLPDSLPGSPPPRLHRSTPTSFLNVWGNPNLPPYPTTFSPLPQTIQSPQISHSFSPKPPLHLPQPLSPLPPNTLTHRPHTPPSNPPPLSYFLDR